MKIMRMTSPYGFDEYRQAVLDWARAKRFREDVHMRLVTYFGFGGAGDVKKYRPEEIEIGAWVAGGGRPHDDALILNRDGKLAEASGANVMLVRDGQLITPSVTAGILEGITRATLMGLFAKVRNRPAVEREVDRTELYLADEILICGSAEEVTPVVSVDRIPVGDGKPGPLTRELQEAFFRATRGKDPDFADVLTPIY